MALCYIHRSMSHSVIIGHPLQSMGTNIKTHKWTESEKEPPSELNPTGPNKQTRHITLFRPNSVGKNRIAYLQLLSLRQKEIFPQAVFTSLSWRKWHLLLIHSVTLSLVCNLHKHFRSQLGFKLCLENEWALPWVHEKETHQFCWEYSRLSPET